MVINNNDDRSARAMRALEAYKANDWRGRRGTEAPDGDEILEAVGDLLGDLHHLTDRTPPSDALERAADALAGRDLRWDCLTDRGDFHYREEVAEEALEARGVTSWTMGEAGAKLAAIRQAQFVAQAAAGDPGELAEHLHLLPREVDRFEHQGILRAFYDCLYDRIGEGFEVEATWLEQWVLDNADRIEAAAFAEMDRLEHDAFAAWTDARVDQAERQRERGE